MNYVNFAAYWICVAEAERKFKLSGGKAEDLAEMFNGIRRARAIAADGDKAVRVVSDWVLRKEMEG